MVEGLTSPLTVGWLRPVILLPTALVSGMPAHLLEALLAHEMAHIARKDYLVNLGQNVIEILLFYHPAVWWISGRIRREREQIADDIAARHTGQPRMLAQALSALERLQSGGALAMAASGGDLLARVRRLLRPDAQAVSWKAALPVLALALAGLGVYVNAAARAPSIDSLIVDRPPMMDFRSCAKPVYPADDLAVTTPARSRWACMWTRTARCARRGSTAPAAIVAWTARPWTAGAVQVRPRPVARL
ncbi:M56 family metallopeptidase [Massilia sp. B-10]|nr:M56 family metallopeptidase [Massilia sp. B-10]